MPPPALPLWSGLFSQLLSAPPSLSPFQPPLSALTGLAFLCLAVHMALFPDKCPSFPFSFRLLSPLSLSPSLSLLSLFSLSLNNNDGDSPGAKKSGSALSLDSLASSSPAYNTPFVTVAFAPNVVVVVAVPQPSPLKMVCVHVYVVVVAGAKERGERERREEREPCLLHTSVSL